MTDLASHLERLGLEQYLDAFVGEGFDTWETLLDIQESDLDALNVKLGHRRKLQRAILDHRGISYDRFLGSPARDTVTDPPKQSDTSSLNAAREGAAAAVAETKRKYRRHPKPDEHAPEKPPSAYVLFSNRVREEVKAENLSFTEIAKLVGDRWQKLEPTHKEPFESQAAALKEQYSIKLSAYKKTDLYQEYSQYLADFKAKQGQGSNVESKRPRLDPQSSGGSASAASFEVPDVAATAPGHVRGSSNGSIGVASQPGNMISPSLHAGHTGALPSLIPSTSSLGLVRPRSGSPPMGAFGRERRLRTELSTQSSASDESGVGCGDLYEPLSRTATLSMSTPPVITPPLLPRALNSTRPEHGSSIESFTWPSRNITGLPQQYPPVPDANMHALTLLSPTASGDLWRERASDPQRKLSTSSAASHAAFSATLPLPTLFAPERLSDFARTQVQRTLPPIRPGPPSGLLPTFASALPSPNTYDPVHGGSRISHEGPGPGTRSLDRTENEAATTLAELARRPNYDGPPSVLRRE